MRYSRLLTGLALGLTLALLSGCYHVRYHRKCSYQGPPVARWNHFFLWGLAGSAEVDVREFCPQGMARVVTHRSAGNIVVSILTLGLYSPSMVEVWCAAPGTLQRPAPAPTRAPAPQPSHVPTVDPEQPTRAPGTDTEEPPKGGAR